MSEEYKPQKRENEVSSSNALSLKLNGKKVSVPLQGSTLLAVLGIAWQSYVAFGTMQQDVNTMTEATIQMSTTVDKMKIDLAETNKAVAENSKARPELENLRRTHREDLAKTTKRIEVLEKCIRKPRRCEL